VIFLDFHGGTVADTLLHAAKKNFIPFGAGTKGGE
jgi:hypothetical protein